MSPTPSEQQRPARGAIGGLARVLDLPVEELAFLEPLPHTHVEALSTAIAGTISSESRGTIERLARISSVVPSPVAAQVAHRALGPQVSARLLPLLPPRLAADIAGRVPGKFLAEVASAAHPSELRAVVPGLTVRTLKAAAHHLSGPGDHLTIASVAGVIDSADLPTLLGALDPASILATTVYVDDAVLLDQLIAALSDEDLRGLVQSAHDLGQWEPALDLIDRVQPHTQGRLAGLVLSLPDEVLAGALRAATALDAWSAVLALLPTLEADDHVRAASSAAFGELDVLEGLIAAVTDLGAWPQVLALVPELPDTSRSALVDAASALVTDLREAELARLIESLIGLDDSLDPAEVAIGVDLLSEMSDPAIDRLASWAASVPAAQAKPLAPILGSRSPKPSKAPSNKAKAGPKKGRQEH